MILAHIKYNQFGKINYDCNTLFYIRCEISNLFDQCDVQLSWQPKGYKF